MNMFTTFVRFIRDITGKWKALFTRRCDDLLTCHIFRSKIELGTFPEIAGNVYKLEPCYYLIGAIY